MRLNFRSPSRELGENSPSRKIAESVALNGVRKTFTLRRRKRGVVCGLALLCAIEDHPSRWSPDQNPENTLSSFRSAR